MKLHKDPILDTSSKEDLFNELTHRVPAFVPDWYPSPEHPSWSVIQAYLRMARSIIDRLNDAPRKEGLAFLDMLGIGLTPAQSSRVPVVFNLLPNSGDGHAPAGTRLGASNDRSGDGVIPFETETPIGLASARLANVFTIWPQIDAYEDHSAAFRAGQSFRLFNSPQDIPHILYFSHNILCALEDNSQLEVTLEFLLDKKNPPLNLIWEYWNGSLWQPFTINNDGTAGFTQNGNVLLNVPLGKAKRVSINSEESYWIRARLDGSLASHSVDELPTIKNVWLRSIIEQPFNNMVSNLLPDFAHNDGIQIDLTKSFLPLGQVPRPGASFYFCCEEAFSKPGAHVTICFSKQSTPETEAAAEAEQAEQTIEEARKELIAISKNAGWTLFQIANQLGISIGKNFSDALNDVNNITPDEGILPKITKLKDTAKDINNKIKSFSKPPTNDKWVIALLNETKSASEDAFQVLQALSNINPTAASVISAKKTKLTGPQLVWEYWNGDSWATILGPSPNPSINFKEESNKAISFDVPYDWVPSESLGVTERWMRVRLKSGSYDNLRIISWHDSKADYTNIIPVLEPRPPMLESFYLGYSYSSPYIKPEKINTYNDFDYKDHSDEVLLNGGSFAPFELSTDHLPTLYLGFDRDLPSDLVSFYLDINHEEGFFSGQSLRWEQWNGSNWQELTVSDETSSFIQSGIVSFAAQQRYKPRQEANIHRAEGNKVELSDPLLAARFAPGTRVSIGLGDKTELSIVKDIAGTQIKLVNSLSLSYTSGKIIEADLMKFGETRTWVRAQFENQSNLNSSKINGISLNAVWAVQRQTVSDEILGSSTEQPNQVYFLKYKPVQKGTHIEVRELFGNRASVEYPILVEEILHQGLSKDEIRTVVDPRTGKANEVWVRWQQRPHLYNSGASDRHYIIEKERGRIIFGDGVNGKIPPVGTNNVLARLYQAGGGTKGNIAEGKLNQLLSMATPAHSVINLKSAEGGADGEHFEGVEYRGPQDLRHRWRGLSALDYEWLAREASPDVALSRVLPLTSPDGSPAPGWITVIIVPAGIESQPQPSIELKRRVQEYLENRAPAGIAGINVIGPKYLPVDVIAYVVPKTGQPVGIVKGNVNRAVTNFLHPISGGPEGIGWSFGQNVCLSDLAVVLETVEGVDYAKEILLCLDGSPQGAMVIVSPDQIVTSGNIQIELCIADSGEK